MVGQFHPSSPTLSEKIIASRIIFKVEEIPSLISYALSEKNTYDWNVIKIKLIHPLDQVMFPLDFF